MSKHEAEQRKQEKFVRTGDINNNSPWAQEKAFLVKELEDLDKYQFSLSENEQTLRESMWITGRDEIRVKLADIRLKEIETGFLDPDSPEETYEPSRPSQFEARAKPEDKHSHRTNA